MEGAIRPDRETRRFPVPVFPEARAVHGEISLAIRPAERQARGVMKTEEDFMRHAIGLARAGMLRGEGGPFGAVVVRAGEIVGEGWNRVLANADPTAHGEVVAIRDACARLGTHVLDDCEIFTTGQPCPMCLGAIYWARLRKIHYGFRIGDAAEIGFDDREFFQQIALPSAARRVPEVEVGRPEALALAREYAALPHRKY